jgi:hypothetical protein
MDGTWKAPLREAMESVAAQVDEAFERFAGELLDDPWKSLEHYARVILKQTTFDSWLEEEGAAPMDIDRRLQLQSLFEAEAERQRMFTSCGWFFEDFDRIEPRNNVMYAAHAIWLAERASSDDLYQDSASAFGKVASPRTGLRVDDVFSSAFYRFGNRS